MTMATEKLSLRQMLARRQELRTQMISLDERSDPKTHKLGAEDQAQFDKLFDEADSLRSRIERQEKLRGMEGNGTERILPAGAGAETAEQRQRQDQFRNYLRTGETRDMQADVFAQGGALIPPMQFIDRIIKGVDDLVFVRQRAHKERLTTSMSLGAPTQDTDVADSDWTPEIVAASADTSLRVGRRELKPSQLSKLIKVSNPLLRTKPDIDNYVADRLIYKAAITQEKAFLTGTGAGQPLGIFTAHADGVPTSRDVSTGNSTTAMTFDGLINAKYKCKAQYHRNGSWMFHRDGVKSLALLKDGNGQYIWQPSKQLGDPDRILGNPVDMSENVPATFTSGLYVGMFADLSAGYWIVDSLDLTIQRLTELYAVTNQTGFIGRLETDGQPVLSEAFARVKLA